MTRSIHRRSLAARLLSAYVVLVVLVSFTGLSYAAPQGGSGNGQQVKESPASVPVEKPAEETPPAEAPTQVVVEPPAAPVAMSDPLPTATAKSAQSKTAPAPDASEPAIAAPTVAPSPTEVSAQITLEGFNEEGGSWTTGNLKNREEGDWVEHRIIIDNVNGSGTYVMPASTVLADHYWDNPNAIFYDRTRLWSFVSMTGEPSDTDRNQPAGATSFALTGQDFGVNGTWGVDAEQIGTSWAAGTIQVPAGSYGVIYWQSHLALSAYWMQVAGIWGAGPWSPGAPSHTWLEITNVGAKKVPIPSVDLPGGDISGLKFYDAANLGTYDAGEKGLGGWVFHLTGGPAGWQPLDLTATSAADGTFAFDYLPPGTYELDEELQTGWATAYNLPLTITITGGETVDVEVGNYHTDITKTFELYIGENAQMGVPAGTTLFARYWIDGNASPEADLALSGSGGHYTADVDLPYGTVIDKVEWWASLLGEEYLLGTQYPDETLTEAVTNTFNYDSFLAGRKWNDLDADGEKGDAEPWLSGWTIELRRASDDSVYATDVTDSDGIYNFRDVLPGEYYVVEVMQAGWFQTHAPSGTVTVEHGTAIEGLCFGNIEVLSDIDVTKSGPTMARIGDLITYEITVTNSGHTTLTGVEVYDPLFGGVIGTIPVLAAGASQTFHPQYTVQDTDPDPLPNTVMASGVDLLGEIKTAAADWEVDIVHPDFTLDKSVAPDVVAYEGDVLYTYVIENTGDIALDGLTLVDDVLGTITLTDTDMDPGDTITVTAPWHVTDDTTNVAVATAYDPWGDPYERQDTAFVDVRDPAISVVKSADPTVIHEGDMVTYTYLVTNVGDTTLTDITLSDNILGDLTYLLGATTLAPGASTQAEITVPISDDVTNVGYVTGVYGEPGSDFSGMVDDSSSAEVDVIFPGLEVRKAADPTVILAGEAVTYTYEVENIGDVVLTGVTLTDDQLGVITLTDTVLDPGEIAYGTATVPINQDTLNVATGTGYDPLGAPHSDEAEAEVDVVDPDVEIDKSVSPGMVAYSGTVYYDYAVTNDGDVTLYDIEVVDDVIGVIGTIDELAPGDTYTFWDVPWNVTDDTPNTGTATGYGFWGHPASDSDDEFVDVTHPAIQIVKSADPTTIHEGDMVTYAYLITNTGDDALWGITLDDSVLGDLSYLLPVTMLAPGGSTLVEITVPVVDDVTNIGHVEGLYGDPQTESGYYGMVEDDSSADVDVIFPDIEVRKAADPTVILAGEAVTYTYEVENIGDVVLTGVTLTDDQLGSITLTDGVLDPGEIAYGTANAAITQDTVNVATATGTDPLGDPVSDTAEASVDVVDPQLEIVKTVWPQTVAYSGVVWYDYIVTNTGDVTLYDIVVDDDVMGYIGTITQLDPGDSSAIWGIPWIVSDDTLNVATAAGHDAWEHLAWDDDDAFVDVTNPAIEVVKTADPTVVHEGDQVTYTYVVTNTGDDTLHDITLSDDILGDLTALLGATTLAPGGSTQAQTTVPVNDDVVNVATVVGAYGTFSTESGYYGTVSDESSAEVDVIFPAIEVRKAADPTVILTGDAVTYTYEVENTGDVPLTDVTLLDDQLGDITLDDVALDPGEVAYGSSTVPIDVDTVNVATATGTDPLGAPVTDNAEASVDVVNPALTVEKSAVPEVIAFGGGVLYDYLVTNTGDVTLYDISVDDDVIGHIGTIDELAPGASYPFDDVPWTVTDDTVNIVTAAGHDEWGHEATDTADASVDVIHPAIAVDKSVEPTTVLSGDQVIYTYTVTNTGDVPLFDVTLADDVIGAIGTAIPVLDPGDSVSTDVPWTITEDTPNVVTADGWFWPMGEPGAVQYLGRVSDEAEAFVDVVAPAIDVVKTASPTVLVYEGDVTYEYTITNTGDVPLFDVDAVDDQLGTVAENLALGVGESTVVTVAAAGISEDVVNVVDVTATDAWGHPVSDSAEASVDVINPYVSIDKSVDPSVILSGEEVVYTYVVQNTGDVTLWGLWVDDDHLGEVGTQGALAPGESWTFTVPAAIAEDTANIATVTAGFGFFDQLDGEDAAFDGFVTDSDDAFVDVVAPAIDVVKTGSTASVVEPGEDVTYTYTVTNTGDVPLFDVELVDDQLGAVGAVGLLNVGESMEFESSSFIAVDTANIVTATGVDEWGHEVSDADDWNVVVEPFLTFPPDLTITKVADKDTAKPGDTVTYTLVYTNLDPNPAVTASDFTITDDFDEHYMSVVDASGGTVSNGTITWTIPGPLGGGESGTISYTLKVAETMPEGTTNVDNVVVIRYPDDPNPDNDRDTERVPVSEEEPFLPFTGGDAAMLLGAIALASVAGVSLRRFARKAA